MKCTVCGCDVADSKLRSVPQLRRYFQLVRQAFLHWPEGHPRQFTSEEECRKWLQMAAGAREVGAELPLTGMPRERALLLAEMAIRAAGAHAHPVLHGDRLVIWVPRSIRFARMPHAEFCALSDAVADVIARDTGLTAEQLLANAMEAA